jgi:hypothetical protein
MCEASGSDGCGPKKLAQKRNGKVGKMGALFGEHPTRATDLSFLGPAPPWDPRAP